MAIGIGIGAQLGGAPSFTPKSIAGIKSWVRADLGITIVTGVSAWADQSGGGINWTQANTTLQPTIGSGINGLPTLVFDGTGDRLQASNTVANTITNSSGTVYIVCKPTSLTITTATRANQAHRVFTDTADYLGIGMQNAAAGVLASNYDGTWDTASDTSAGANVATILTWMHGGGTLTVRRDNRTAVTTASGNTQLTSGTFCIGGSTTTFFTGEVAEVIVYNVALSGADDTAVRAYLSARYAIP